MRFFEHMTFNTKGRAARLVGALRRHRRWLVPLAPALLVVLVFALDRLRYRGEVLRGVSVGGLTLSGRSYAAALTELNVLSSRLQSHSLHVAIGESVFERSPHALGLSFDGQRTATQALAAGRSGSVINQFWWWLKTWAGQQPVDLVVDVDRRLMDRTLRDLEREAIAQRPYVGGVRVKAGRAVAQPPRAGSIIERGGAERILSEHFARGRRNTVALPLVVVTPNTSAQVIRQAANRAGRLIADDVVLFSDAEGARVTFSKALLESALTSDLAADGQSLTLSFDEKKLEPALASYRKNHIRSPQDARFEIDAQDRVRVVPSRNGSVLSGADVAEAVLRGGYSKARVGRLPVRRGAVPELTTEQALALNVRGLVSRFTTFHPCCRPRVDNIHRIADLLDGTVVRPGEIFSVNAFVGPRTKRNGFVPAPTIEEGEMVDALGGGVSQFATTFFNAVFYGGYDIIERQPHSYYFSRYPMGHEATLSWPKPDIIFRNDTKSGALIRCLYSKTSITVKIYGDNGGRRVRATRSAQFAIKQPPVEFVADDELLPDEEKVDEAGQIGWSVIVGRVITFPDSKTKEEKRKVIYNPRVRRVRLHSCRIPKDEPGYTGEECPEVEEDGGAEASEDAGPP